MARRSRKLGQRRSTAEVGDRDRCRIDGAKLRKLRMDAELSIRALAFAAGVDPKTITDLEAGRRGWSTIRIARDLASHPAIDVDWTDLRAGGDSAEAPRKATASLPSGSSLDAFVEAERRLAPLPAVGGLPAFGAAELVNVFASPGSCEGERFYARGLVHSQRGLPPADATVLGIRYEHAARFEIVRSIGSLDRPLALTVVAGSAAHTRALQSAWRERREIMLTIAVVVASLTDDDAQVSVTNLNVGAPHLRPRPRIGAEPWRGFTHIGAKSEAPGRPHPWILVVESVGSPKK
jgi:transcriptional regulator with XRE-family HTH domain